TAVRVVLERVEIPRLGSELERELRDLPGGPGMVRRELAALLGLAPAAPASREDDRGRLELVLAAAGAPAVARRLERRERRAREGRDPGGLDGIAKSFRDRVPGPVADLEQALARRAAAAGETVAAVLA